MTYPLPIYLIGCPAPIAEAVAGPVANAGGAVAAAFPSVAEATAAVRRGGAAVALIAVVDEGGLAALRALRTVAPAVAALALTDRTRFVPALEAGAAQAVLTPLAPGDLEAALAALAEGFEPVDRPTDATTVAPRREAAPAGGGRVVAVTGACGGTGATTLAVNLAVELADLGAAVVLAEPTQPVGRLALFLDAHPAFTTADLGGPDGRIDPRLATRALHPISDRFKILAAEYRPVRSAPAPVAAAGAVAAALRGAADLILLDVPRAYDDAFFDALTGADVAVLVGDQRIPSVRTLQMLTEVLGQSGTEVRVVVNRYDPGMAGFAAANLRVMLQVPAVWTVADDPKAAAAAINAGKPLKAAAPRSAAAADIARLARDLSAAVRDVPAAQPPLLGRLARAVGLGGGGR